MIAYIIIVPYNYLQQYRQNQSPMKCARKNGIRYALELNYLQQAQPDTDTPRFASRQAKHLQQMQPIDSLSTKKQNKQQEADNNCFSFQKRKANDLQPGQNQRNRNKINLQILDKNSQFIKLEENMSVQSGQSKSVLSLNSLKERLASRSASNKIRQIREIVRTRQSKTTSHLVPFKLDSPANKKDAAFNKQTSSLTKSKSRQNVSTTKKYFHNQRPFKNQGTKLFDFQNQNSKQNLQNKLKTDHKRDTFSQPNMFEKGRSLKSILSKTKPILQIKSRILSNDKLQNFSQILEQLQQ